MYGLQCIFLNTADLSGVMVEHRGGGTAFPGSSPQRGYERQLLQLT